MGFGLLDTIFPGLGSAVNQVAPKATPVVNKVVIAGSLAGAAAAGAAALGAGTVLASSAGAGGGAAGASSLEAGTQTAADQSSNIISSATDATTSFLQSAKSVLSTVAESVKGIVDEVKAFQDSVIAPILNPISQAITLTTSLTQTLERDLHGGIQGLLKIPSDFGNALTSLDATLARSLDMLGVSNRDNAANVLVPGIASGVGAPIVRLGDLFSAVLPQARSTFEAPPQFSLTEGEHVQIFQEYVKNARAKIAGDDSLVGAIFNTLFEAAAVLQGLIIEREPFVDLWRESVQQQAGVKKLDAATLQELVQRREVSQDQAVAELRTFGFTAERAKAMLALSRTLISPSSVVTLYVRDWLQQDVAIEMLQDQGYNREDALSLLTAGHTEIDPSTLQELLRRGLISGQDAVVSLVRQGYHATDAQAILETATRLLGAQDLFSLWDRAAIESASLGFNAITQPVPDALYERLALLGISHDDATTLWSNHWQLLTPALAVQAWFRGYINGNQLAQCLSAASLPVELHQNYIDLNRPLVPERSITTLMSQGIISQVEAENVLRQRGFDDTSINWLVQIERAASKPSQAAAADHVHGLTQSTVLGLYDAGTLERQEAAGLLLKLGWAQEAVDSVLSLHDVKAAAAERTSGIDLIIARAKAGLIGYGDALGQLQQLQLTTRELNAALTRLTTEITQHTKLPGEAKILSMWKHGLLDQAATLDALTLLGYSQAWAVLLIELEGASGTQQSGQASTG